MPKTPRAIREPLDAGSKSEQLPDSPPRRPVIPLAGFPAGNLQRGMLEAKNAPRFDPRQREGTLPHQRGLKSPGNVLTHHAASFRPSSLQASSPSASGVSLIIRPVSSRRLPGGLPFPCFCPGDKLFTKNSQLKLQFGHFCDIWILQSLCNRRTAVKGADENERITDHRPKKAVWR